MKHSKHWMCIVIGLVAFSPACTSFFRATKSIFGGAHTSVRRVAPAGQDLPGISSIGIAEVRGDPETAASLAGDLGTWFSRSERFALLERERIGSLALERGCASGDASCLSASLPPASAVIFGNVTASAYRENVETKTYDCNSDGKKDCTERIRKGTARVGADLRVVEVATGKVLFQRSIVKTRTAQENSYSDNAPESIDGFALLDAAREELSQEFYEEVSPHDVYEKVPIESDGDLPDLDRGNELLEQGQLDAAVEVYRRAVAAGDASKELDPEVKGMAHYNLGIGLASLARYDDALVELRKATALSAEERWTEVVRQVQSWKQDVGRVNKQLAYRQPQAAPTGTAVVSGAGTTVEQPSGPTP